MQQQFHITCPSGATLSEVEDAIVGSRVVYQLEKPVYEPIKLGPEVFSYSGDIHILNDSVIPAGMRVISS